jgi:excinuclease ABC subunit C
MSAFIQKEKTDLTKKVRELPHKPGVYIMRDRLHRVIYVGKARDLRKRVGQYFMPSRKMTADLKTRALLDSIWDFEVHLVKSEPEALLLEGRLIKEFRPKYNVSFRDDKRFLLVKVDERENWPRFRFARIKKDDGARYFGPYANAGALRETINFMRKKFGVLTFGRGDPSDRELKYSSYQVPSRLSDIDAGQYRERVARACAFLAGDTPELIEQLDADMRAAAAELDFERAAKLRTMLEDLRQTMKPMRRFTRHSLPSSIDPAADLVALKDALQLPAPPSMMECFDISNISTTHIVASMVCFRDGVPDRSNYRRYRIKTVGGQDDFASMAEVVRRRYSRVLLEAKDRAEGGRRSAEGEEAGALVDYSGEFSQEDTLDAVRREELKQSSPSSLRLQPFIVRIPDLIIVDGGKGQLGSACRELQRLGLHEVPIIGLAKEFEEIHRPGRPFPLRLPGDSGALRLLQRIRDEAHRFANGYHQLLMKRRIAESILDDCPGVSENRKQLLLRRFGSVSRLRKATVDEIAATEGIGRKLAEQVAEFLAAR